MYCVHLISEDVINKRIWPTICFVRCTYIIKKYFYKFPKLIWGKFFFTSTRFQRNFFTARSSPANRNYCLHGLFFLYTKVTATGFYNNIFVSLETETKIVWNDKTSRLLNLTTTRCV